MFDVRLRILDNGPERKPFLPSSGYGFLLSEWLLRGRPIPLFGGHPSAGGGRIANGGRSRSSRRRGRHPSFLSPGCSRRTLLVAAIFLNRLVGS